MVERNFRVFFVLFLFEGKGFLESIFAIHENSPEFWEPICSERFPNAGGLSCLSDISG